MTTMRLGMYVGTGNMHDGKSDALDAWTDIHLDTMRGLAALVVALGHARGLSLPSFTGGSVSPEGAAQQATTSAGQLSIGHEAVMVFFVLSGYLVGGSVLKALSAG
jgi:peptidoglycan/LPS O-acetylase OafA/YrhL